MWVDVAGISPGPMECPAGDLFSGQAAHVSPSSSECGTPMIGPGPHAAQTAGDCGPASTPRDVRPFIFVRRCPILSVRATSSLRTVMFFTYFVTPARLPTSCDSSYFGRWPGGMCTYFIYSAITGIRMPCTVCITMGRQEAGRAWQVTFKTVDRRDFCRGTLPPERTEDEVRRWAMDQCAIYGVPYVVIERW